MGSGGFEKLKFRLEISKFLKISKNGKKIKKEGVPAPRIIRAGNRSTVHRSLPYRTAANWPDPGPAKIHDSGRHFYVFKELLYYELLVCYIQIIFIILKFDFV